MEIKFQNPQNDVLSSHTSKSFRNKSAKKNKFLGVRQRPSGKWVAEIKNTTQKIRMWLGTFDTAEAAARAYDEAAILLRGSNTRKNFVDHCPSNSPISMKIIGLLNQKKASKQNLTFKPTNPTNKTTKKTSSQTISHILPIGLNQDLNIIHEELPMYNFSFHQPNPVIETSTRTSSQASSPQSYSGNTSLATSEGLNQDLFHDDVYRPDMSQCLDGGITMDTFRFGQSFGDEFYHFLSTKGDMLGQKVDVLAPEISDNRFPVFEHVKVERQISSLYAMNGVNEYWQNFNTPSYSLWDLPMVSQMFFSS